MRLLCNISIPFKGHYEVYYVSNCYIFCTVSKSWNSCSRNEERAAQASTLMKKQPGLHKLISILHNCYSLSSRKRADGTVMYALRVLCHSFGTSSHLPTTPACLVTSLSHPSAHCNHLLTQLLLIANQPGPWYPSLTETRCQIVLRPVMQDSPALPFGLISCLWPTCLACPADCAAASVETASPAADLRNFPFRQAPEWLCHSAPPWLPVARRRSQRCHTCLCVRSEGFSTSWLLPPRHHHLLPPIWYCDPNYT